MTNAQRNNGNDARYAAQSPPAAQSCAEPVLRRGDIALRPIVHLVDDDADFCRSLARLLEVCGYHVATYQSAAEFLNNVNPNIPGCVLLDVAMPDLDGLSLQRRLKSSDSALGLCLSAGVRTYEPALPQSRRALKTSFVNPLADRKSLRLLNGLLNETDVNWSYELGPRS